MTVLECLYYLCSMLCTILVSEWTYHWLVKDKQRYIVAGIIYFTGFVVRFVELETLFPLFVIPLVGSWIAWYIICEGKFRDKIFKMLGIYFVLCASEALIHVAIETVSASFISEKWIALVSVMLLMGIFAIITKQKWYQNIIDYMKVLSRWKSVLILCIIITGTLAIAFAGVIEDIIESAEIVTIFRTIMAIIMCTVAIMILWLIIESYEKKYYLDQNALKEEYIQIQKDYYKTIYEKEKEMRSFRHDIASHLGLLKTLMEREESEKAKEYLENIYNEFESASFQKIYVGDDLLDAIISMMNKQAVEKGISLEVTGKIENARDNDIYELCTIFTNAISNAIEACISVKSKGPIIIKVLEHNKRLFLTIENPATQEMYRNVLQEETSKTNKNNHGYGVLNIRRAVSRLQGSMEYHFEEEKIILEIAV